MSDSVYSEINFHITWHTKSSLPMLTPAIENRLYHYLTHKIIETPGAYLHANGGIATHVHIGVSLEPNILVSDWIGKLKGGSSHYINHEVQPKAIEWQRIRHCYFRNARSEMGCRIYRKSEGAS